MKETTIKTELYITILIVFSMIAGLFFIGKFGFDTLSGVRAYIGGEGLWAKNQKDACYHLIQYVVSRNQGHYEDFLANLRVPLGDRKARLELDKDNPDENVIFGGFLEGGNHPDDIPHMISLYRKFRNNKPINSAIEQWRTGDRLIEELLQLGEKIHGRISSGDISGIEQGNIIDSIDDLQHQLSRAENAFSAQMSIASRWAVDLLLKMMLSFTVIAGAVCMGMFVFVGKIISKLEKYRDDLVLLVDLDRVTKKELEIERDQLQTALAEIRTLRGIIPICSHCKSIRSDEGIWSQLEQYIHDHSEAEFSHSVCPDCARKIYPDIFGKEEP